MKTKPLGIMVFLNKLDGKEPPKEEDYSGYYYSDTLGSGMKKHIRTVLEGDSDSLMWAFTWGNTPQGHDYWYKRCEGRVTCTPEDIKYMEWLLYEFE